MQILSVKVVKFSWSGLYAVGSALFWEGMALRFDFSPIAIVFQNTWKIGEVENQLVFCLTFLSSLPLINSLRGTEERNEKQQPG